MPPLHSRRNFLKQTGGVLAALALPPASGLALPQGPTHGTRQEYRRFLDLPLPAADLRNRAQLTMGRVTTYRLNLHAAPDVDSEIVGHKVMDDLVNILGAAEGPGEMPHNSLWFQVTGGYLYSSFVQPVDQQFNQPMLPSDVNPEHPILLEVTVPYTDVYRRPIETDWRTYRLYYSTTHWAVGVERDEEMRSWYKLRNDRGQGYYYARAEHLRYLPPNELAPISPGRDDKRVEINLTQQTLTAYEGNNAVLHSVVSTGAVFAGERYFVTPAGTFQIWRKRASRHMAGGTPGVDYYNLPGIPWVGYFSGGVALHGTYWHNDYGRQRSHGCVNLTPEHARWLYLWTDPWVPYYEEILDTQAGQQSTPVHVFYE